MNIDKESIINENKSLIDMTIGSILADEISTNLENYLLLAVIDGWQELVNAIRLIINGERKLEKFANLDEEDSIVIKKILEMINEPDIQVQSILLNAQKHLYDSVTTSHDLVKSALALSPKNPSALAMMGQVLHIQNKLQAASGAYRQSLSYLKKQPQVLLNLGAVLNDLKKYDEAIDAFKQVLNYQADNLDAMSHLAYLYERSYLLEQSIEIVNKGLSINPNHATLLFISGKLEQRENNAEKAIELINRSLELSLTSTLHGDAYSRLGYLYDRIGETKNSIACFTQANSHYKQECQDKNIKKDSFIKEAENLNKFSERISTIKKEDIDNNIDPVFLIGFPRSGTTLLNQILDSHLAIQTLEEKPLVGNLVNKLYKLSKNKPILKSQDILELRNTYFKSINQYLTLKPESLFIDKLPLNIAYVPLLSKIFPNAKYIIALRHPYDTCLSCFMHSFGLNSAMRNFTNIEDTISLYIKLLSDWENYSITNKLSLHRIRYEDVVNNFQSETEKLLKFLNLDWDNNVNSHTTNAQNKGFIDTPSYDQVTKPLYKDAIFRWKKYQTLFEAHKVELAPLIKEYGYDNL